MAEGSSEPWRPAPQTKEQREGLAADQLIGAPLMMATPLAWPGLVCLLRSAEGVGDLRYGLELDRLVVAPTTRPLAFLRWDSERRGGQRRAGSCAGIDVAWHARPRRVLMGPQV